MHDRAPNVNVNVNGAWIGQRITGQQRYAAEITKRLSTLEAVRALYPPRRMSGSALASWAWAQALPLRGGRSSWTVSLTSRAPLFGRRHAYTVHDLFPLTNPEWYSTRYVKSHAPLLKAHIAGATLLIAVSKATAEAVRERLGYRGPIVIAPNAPSEVFLTQSPAPPEVLINGTALRADRFLLTVGTRDPRKNQRRLEEAYRQLPMGLRRELPLVLVGGHTSHFATETDPASDQQVLRLGYVTDSELADLYKMARAVVYPSLNEGFGLPVVEALATGARVAISDIPVFREVLTDQPADYFDPTDVESMSQALLKVATSGRSAIRPQVLYSWNDSAMSIYRALSREDC